MAHIPHATDLFLESKPSIIFAGGNTDLAAKQLSPSQPDVVALHSSDPLAFLEWVYSGAYLTLLIHPKLQEDSLQLPHVGPWSWSLKVLCAILLFVRIFKCLFFSRRISIFWRWMVLLGMTGFLFNAQSQSLLRILAGSAGMVCVSSTSASIQETSATGARLSPVSLQQQQHTVLSPVSEPKGTSMPSWSSSNASLRLGPVCVFRGQFPSQFFFPEKKKQQGSYSGCKSRKVASVKSSQQSWRCFSSSREGQCGSGLYLFLFKTLLHWMVSATRARFPWHVRVLSIEEKSLWKTTLHSSRTCALTFFAWMIINGLHFCRVAFRGPKDYCVCLGSNSE